MPGAVPAFIRDAEMVFVPPTPPSIVTPAPIEPPGPANNELLPAPRLIGAECAPSSVTTSLPEPPVNDWPPANSTVTAPVEALASITAEAFKLVRLLAKFPAPEIVIDAAVGAINSDKDRFTSSINVIVVAAVVWIYSSDGKPTA